MSGSQWKPPALPEVTHSSGIRVRVGQNKIRVPEVVFLHKDHFASRHNRIWDGADLAMEIVSESAQDRQRDYETKLTDYVAAGGAEYWIIDYEQKRVIVHPLDGDKYVTHGEFTIGQQADSALLPGFNVDVSALFAAADDVPE